MYNSSQEQSEERLVLLKSFTFWPNSLFLKGRLESEGISCYLFDENTIHINPLLSAGINGVKLMVPERQVLKATQILQSIEEEWNINRPEKITYLGMPYSSYEGFCPECESGNIYVRRFSLWKEVFWGTGTIMTGMPFKPAYHFYCNNCDHEWDTFHPYLPKWLNRIIRMFS